jgi:hypothetical protein
MGETETKVDGETGGAGKRMRQAFKDPKFVIMFVIAMVGLTWGTIQFVQNQRAREALSERQPDTYVVAYGMEHSYSIDELREQGAITYRATISAVQVPGGFLSVEEAAAPIWFFEWTYSDDEKVYIVTVDNRGAGIGRKTKVDIDFGASSISSVKIDNEERVKIISGGKPGGNRVVFEIDELLPGEEQYVEMVVVGKSVKSIDVWSESEGTIDNVSIVDVSIGPGTDLVG